MALVHELFVAAITALILSFVVAKLVSIAMAADSERQSSGNQSAEKVAEGVKLDGIEGLRVRRTESERKIHLVEEALEKVDEFRGERSASGSEYSICSKELDEKRCDLEMTCDSAVGMETGEFSGLSEKSPQELLPEEKAMKFISADSAEAPKIKETEDAAANLEGETVGGRNGRTDLGKIDGVKQGNTEKETNIVIKEKIFETADANTNNMVVVDDIVVAQAENQGIEAEMGENKREEKKEGMTDYEEDGWEGIERSELQEVFAAAANYVASWGKDDRLCNVSSDDQMQLYGLHKVAMEGPCQEPQPLPLKFSARAKWFDSCYL